MSEPLSPPPANGAGRNELPAYLSNGVVGLRVRENPLLVGMALLNGYTGLHPERRIEAAAIAPYPLAADIAVNNVWLSDVPHQVEIRDQFYDFATGELTTRLYFDACGVRVGLIILTFCCRHQPTLLVQEIAVTCNRACDLNLQCLIATTEIAGRLVSKATCTPGAGNNDFDLSLLWESQGGLSRCGLALVSDLVARDVMRQKPAAGNHGPFAIQYALRARANSDYRLRQIVSMVPSAMHSQPNRHAERLVALGKHQGFANLRRANRAEWRELWKGRIQLHGREVARWQRLADAAFFYMNASVHVSSSASTSMFGLAIWHDYHYYYGHVMWDIESFSVPSLSVTQPEAAKALLEYRVRMLPGARANAQSFGRGGLQFPWESAPATGQEASPSPGTAAWHEDHVSLDVALAFIRHALVSGDENFLRDKAWPVVAGVAEWIVSRSHETRRGFEIRRSMGIAERKKEADNDSFTNISAKMVLAEACRLAKSLGRTPGHDWQRVADRLVLPRRGDLLLPHDGYRADEEKGATPGPLMALYPLGYPLPPMVERTTLNYFLKRARTYIGSPMLSALYGVWASRRGDRQLALRMLEEGYGRFIAPRFCQTLEYRPDRFPEQPMAGPFFANMGGFLMSLLFGFPCLQPGPGAPSDWAVRPAILPQGWSQIAVDRLWLKGRPARLCARNGRKAELQFL